jgi:hypothetical protein
LTQISDLIELNGIGTSATDTPASGGDGGSDRTFILVDDSVGDLNLISSIQTRDLDFAPPAAAT